MPFQGPPRSVVEDVIPRWLVYLSASVLLFAGLADFLAASTEWAARIAMVDSNPPEAAEQAAVVFELHAVGALNLGACMALLFLRWRVTWWLIVGLQAALFVGALAEGFLTDLLGWASFSGLPAGDAPPAYRFATGACTAENVHS